jgi:hypothetical protein
MSEKQPDENVSADLGDQTDAPKVTGGTDIDASDLDVGDGAGGDTPATSDPDAFVDDGGLGGTGGANAGGAG